MIEHTRRIPRAADVAAVCLLLGLPWLLYGSVLGLWWSEDDFFQVRFTLERSPGEYALDPDVWGRLPNRVLSPLLFVSYEADLDLFGLEPRGFYAHQLLSVGLAAAALFLVLRLWLPAVWAALAGVVFLVGPPVASLPPLLMVRHYPEAILLGLVSTGAFVLAARRSGLAAAGLATLSAAVYLAASLAKEIAVPLPGVLALLPVGTPRRRLLLLAPHAALAALYAGYRTWMLGTPLGGYGWTILPGDWAGLVLALPGKIARELAGPSAWGWVALAVLVGAAVAHAAGSRRRAALVAAGLLLALLPVLPASVETTPRLAVAAWLALSAAFAPAARWLTGARHPALATALVALALVTAFAANRAAWAGDLALAERRSAESRGFLELGPGDSLRHPATSPAAMAELKRFARDVLGRAAPGGWFYDDLFLCRRPPGAGRPARPGPHPPLRALWSYDRAAEGLVEITGDLPELRRSYCSGIRWRAPLQGSFRFLGDDVLAWSLGPYEEGSYAFVLEEGRIRHAVSREGAFGLARVPRLTLRVRYESPAGWVTYSPPLTVELAPGRPLDWRREGAEAPPGARDPAVR